MNKINKKALYESIMNKVALQVKKSLNESNADVPCQLGEVYTGNKCKEYGFMTFDENSGTVIVTQFDTPEEFMAEFSTDYEEYVDQLFELEVGETMTTDYEGITTRIW